MAEVRVFHSHIEVYPYEKGNAPQLEKMLSKWVTNSKYNNSGHYEPIAFFIENDILYLPRGISNTLLSSIFGTTPTPVDKFDPYYKITKGVGSFPPKSKIQKEGIEFLCSEGNFNYTKWYSQLGLNLDTGDGKTYATIYSVLKMKLRAIIITHQDNIKLQWIKSLKEMTSFPEENICNITGSDMIDKIMKNEVSGEIYLVNQQTISAYARQHGWTRIRDFFKKIHVGIKVIDEAHKYFENTLMIDFFSNCFKSIYLTATYGRSDSSENAVYKRSYQSMVRFGEETRLYEEKRKHIVASIIYFNSKPQYGVPPQLSTFKGFSSYKYIDYELEEENQSILKVLGRVLTKALSYEGKTLVLSPKVDSVKKLAEYMKEYTDEEIMTIHSKNTQIQNEKAKKEARVISSTIKSVGEGTDIRELRCLINLEPVGSTRLIEQVAGRLREYSEEDDTYLYWIVDSTIPETVNYAKHVMSVLRKKCKEVLVYNFNL